MEDRLDLKAVSALGEVRRQPSLRLVRQIKGSAVEKWHQGLSDDMKRAMSRHDVAALAEIFAEWLVNEMEPERLEVERGPDP